MLSYHLHARGRAWVKLVDADACKMHCINSVVYCVISIIFASYLLVLDDLWGFSYKVPFIYVLTMQAKKACFRISHFQGPSRSQKGLGFLPRHFLGKYKTWSTWTSPGPARDPRKGPWHGQIPWPRHGAHFSPRGSDAVRFYVGCFVLT